MNKWLLGILLFLMFPFTLWAQPPLPPDKAFSLQVWLEREDQLKIEWTIAPGYYLYRDKIHLTFSSTSPVKGQPVVVPSGVEKIKKNMTVFVPLLNPEKGILNLTLFYQGCSSTGFCYIPIKKQLNFDLSRVKAPTALTPFLSSGKNSLSSQDQATEALHTHSLWIVMILFLGLGILLAFTPCVLPLIPILSGIIVGYHRREALTTRRAFFLSLAYVLGMATTYMLLGILMALLGSKIQASLQTPWVIFLFSSIFILLALSLLGFYELNFLRKWEMLIMKWDERFKRGTYPGVFLMGCFSSLIVSPCISAPLVGVFAYILQTGSVVVGALALLALGLGKGIPLLMFGMAAGKYLPKAGPWMGWIQRAMAVVMLGVAVWLMSRLLPGPTVFYAAPSPTAFSFNIKSMTQLHQQFSRAQQEKKPVILDFYANWCPTCKNIDKKILEDPEVRAALQRFIFLRVDVTQNEVFDQAILKKFNVTGPPTFLFFNAKGNEFVLQRLVGEMSKEALLDRLHEIEP